MMEIVVDELYSLGLVVDRILCKMPLAQPTPNAQRPTPNSQWRTPNAQCHLKLATCNLQTWTCNTWQMAHWTCSHGTPMKLFIVFTIYSLIHYWFLEWFDSINDMMDEIFSTLHESYRYCFASNCIVLRGANEAIPSTNDTTSRWSSLYRIYRSDNERLPSWCHWWKWIFSSSLYGQKWKIPYSTNQLFANRLSGEPTSTCIDMVLRTGGT